MSGVTKSCQTTLPGKEVPSEPSGGTLGRSVAQPVMTTAAAKKEWNTVEQLY